MASPYFETASVWLCLHMTVNSGFGMVGRDRFTLAFRTLNQAVSERKESQEPAQNELEVSSKSARRSLSIVKTLLCLH
jgi:hypothetical protein